MSQLIEPMVNWRGECPSAALVSADDHVCYTQPYGVILKFYFFLLEVKVILLMVDVVKSLEEGRRVYVEKGNVLEIKYLRDIGKIAGIPVVHSCPMVFPVPVPL